MKMYYSLIGILLFTGIGCKKASIDAPSPGPTCADEHTLEVYQNREAMVIRTELKRYCLTVDSTDLAQGNYRLQNVLVPTTDLPSQYQVMGLHILLSGRKQSCYGLTTLPNLSNTFGYKLEVDELKDVVKTGKPH